MRSSIALLAATAGTTLASSNNYTEWMASSWLSKSVPVSRNYAYGVLYRGIELAHNKTNNAEYLDFIESQLSGVVSDSGELIDYNLTDKISLDDLRIGTNFLAAWAATGQEKFKLGADTLRRQIDITPRNEGGGLWHRDPTYPNQMWLDGIYMSTNFYALYTAWFDADNSTAWDDIMLQFDLIEEHCLREDGLLVHGFDYSKAAVWAGMSSTSHKSLFHPLPLSSSLIKQESNKSLQILKQVLLHSSGIAPWAGISCPFWISWITFPNPTQAGRPT